MTKIRTFAAICISTALFAIAAGCGGNRKSASSPTTPAGAIDPRAAERIQSVNVKKTGSIAGGIAYDVFVSGNYAYIASDKIFSIIDITNPAAPVNTGIIDTQGGSARGVYVSGNYAYLSNGNSGLLIVDISDPSNPAVAGKYDTPGFSYDVFVSGGYAYVADGTSGLAVINIASPASPVLAGVYDTPGTARNVFVSGALAYVADSSSGLQIINISNPASPTLAGGLSMQGAANAVHVSGGIAYVANSTPGLSLINVSNPASPVAVGSFSVSGGANAVSVSGNYAYVNNSTSFMAVNITSPSAPSLSGSLSLRGPASGIFAVNGYAYVSTLGGWINIVNISAPPSPALAGRYIPPLGTYGVFVTDNYAFVTNTFDNGTGNDSLQIVDISNASAPVMVGQFPVSEGNDPYKVYVSGGYAYLLNGFGGLQIINVSNPAAPALTGSFPLDTNAIFWDNYNVYAAGGFAYAACYSGLYIINVSNPANPTLAGFISSPQGQSSAAIAVSGNLAYWGGRIYNISNPASPSLIGSVSVSDARDIDISGNYAYIASGVNGLTIINISNPASPAVVASFPAGTANEVHINGNYAYVASDSSGLIVVDVSTPSAPKLAGSYPALGGQAFSVASSGSHIVVADYLVGLLILDHATPGTNRPPSVSSCAFTPYSVMAGGTASSTLQCIVSDPDNTISSVTVDLSAIGLSADAPMIKTSGTTWQLAGIIPPASATVRTNYPMITAADVYGATGTSQATLNVTAYVAPPNPKPAVSGCSFTPYSLAAGGTASSTLQCTVTDANNNLSSVSVNLSSIGGSASSALTNTSGSTWRLTGITLPATATVRTNYPVITATDALGATGTSQATLNVTAYVAPPNPKPAVSGCSFTPYRLGAGTATTSTLQCTVTDPNNNLSTVTVNLSALGGSAVTDLTNMGGGTWRKTGITASSASTIGNNYPQITATDALGATGTSQAVMQIYDPAPALSYCAFTPFNIRANGIATTTLQCTVNDLNNNISTVTVNLSSIGGSATAALTNMGGGTWRRAGITASIGTAPATYYPTTTATDSSGGTGTQRATLVISP